MTPHLVKWHEELSDRGLTIIDVDDGGIDRYSDVRLHIRELKIPFAVFYDGLQEVCARYEISAYPTAYLIGADGRVVWEGHPTGAERWRIEEALEQAEKSH
jgi:hypothetical protein